MKTLAAILLTLSATAFCEDATVSYERDIRPLLHHKCAACHGALKQNAGLRLDAGALIRKGGDSGAVVVPGNSDSSEIIQRVTAADASGRMPPEGQGEKLSAEQLRLLKAWIDNGANFPVDEKVPEDPALYWSYLPVREVLVPPVKNTRWVKTPIDVFIAAEHEKRGLLPRAEASRDVWLRRVSLDLTGLPPRRDVLLAFRVNDSPTAFEDVVDGLLARPEYGERWGRHWMDVWRYSDWYGSRGINEIRYSQRHIWRWRDWIVESLNDDKPYNQMIVEMLAGDEISPTDPDTLRATGFLGRNWYKFDRNVWMFETVEQTSQAFLGLTMKCARCHDHKFDPITQEDYYRLRAFFEPHDVRTDPVGGNPATDKDATLGPVLREGVARVFDKTLDAKTYVFQRGDNRYPDESRLMEPDVPRSLVARPHGVEGKPEDGIPQQGGVRSNRLGTSLQESSRTGIIHPISLPTEAWYPHLRPAVVEGVIATADRAITDAESALAGSRDELAAAKIAIAGLAARIERGEIATNATGKAVLSDSFATRSDVWKVASGNWSWTGGKLIESSAGNFSTIVADVVHPRNFTAKVRWRTLQPGNFRSVGFSFDYVDGGNSQDVYTSTADSSQSIQAFHRKDGRQEYPPAGIVPVTLKIGDETTVEVTVRGPQLTITLNGEKKLTYALPVDRRDGKFALWTHSGSAEFLEVELQELVPTLDELRQQHRDAAEHVALAELDVQTARDEAASLRARLIAERAKYGDADDAMKKAAGLEASRAERQVAVSKARRAAVAAEQILAKTNPPGDAKQKRDSAVTALNAAEDNLAKADGSYSPLGEVFPKSSTGRRLALARWIASSANPRTARVAVNHIWLRHFGEAIVPSVANFGLNGQLPSHPELLDWLAGELVASGWKMKTIHRAIVLSATYRQSSAAADCTPLALQEAVSSATPRDVDKDRQSRPARLPLAEREEYPGTQTDPANRFLWRMNSRRMEAEVVRDAILFVSGSLDTTRGGPEIPEGEALTSPRRSIYIRNTPNEKAGLLDTFDIANPNECYRRLESVVPHQSLALMNSSLAIEQSRLLAAKLSSLIDSANTPSLRTAFITAAFETILSRSPTGEELAACDAFLLSNAADSGDVFPAGNTTVRIPPSADPVQRTRENLVLVLFNHNDFVSVR